MNGFTNIYCPGCGRRIIEAANGAIVRGRCQRCKGNFHGMVRDGHFHGDMLGGDHYRGNMGSRSLNGPRVNGRRTVRSNTTLNMKMNGDKNQ